jgi:hypothetical protein
MTDLSQCQFRNLGEVFFRSGLMATSVGKVVPFCYTVSLQ